MTVQSTIDFNAATGLNATSKDALSKLVKAWESKNAQRAVRGAGLGLMAVSLAACGGSGDSSTAPAEPDPVTPVGSDLTVGIDNASFSGTLTAAQAYTPGGNDLVNTLQSGDVITGTGAADVLNVTFGNANDAGGTIVAPTLVGVETINFSSVADDGVGLSLNKATGVSAVNVTSAFGDVGIVDIGSTAIALSVSAIAGNTISVAFDFAASAVERAADAVRLAINGFNGNVISVGDGAVLGGADVEVLNITSSGSASTIAELVSDDLDAINLTASVSTTISALSTETLNTLNLTGSTAATSVNVGANVDANEFAYTGGAGNDTLIMSTGFGATDVLNGGAGTDTLSIRFDETIGAAGSLNAANAAVATNWEALDLRASDAADITIDMDHVPGVTSVSMSAVGGDFNAADFTLNDLTAAQASALSLNLARAGADETTVAYVIVDLAANTTSDSVTLAVTTGADEQYVGLLDANNNIENATVSISSDDDLFLEVDEGSFANSLTVSGGADGALLDMAGEVTSETVNMSGVTSDILIDLGTTDQAVTLGSGDDSVRGNAGEKSINFGAGDDTLEIRSADAVAAAADGTLSVTGLETLELTTALEGDLDVSEFGTGFDVTLQDGVGDFDGNNNTVTLAGIASGATLTLNGTTNDDALIVEVAGADEARRTADELNVVLDADGGFFSLEINAVETLNIESTSGDGGENEVFLQADRVENVVVTGDTDIVFFGNFGGGSDLGDVMPDIEVFDASELTGNLTANLAGILQGAVITAGTGDDNVSGSDFADVVEGGQGDDTLNGNAGADEINGGIGSDEITGGDGADLLTGGAGGDTFAFDDADSGLTLATADVVTDFVAADDAIDLGFRGDIDGNNANYVEATTAVSGYAAALSAANTAFASLQGTSTATEFASFQFDGTNGYLFNDVDGDGVADQVIVLRGIDNTEFSAADLVGQFRLGENPNTSNLTVDDLDADLLFDDTFGGGTPGTDYGNFDIDPGWRVAGLTEVSFSGAGDAFGIPDTFGDYGNDAVNNEQFEVYLGNYVDGIFTVTGEGDNNFDETGATHTMILYDNDTRFAEDPQFLEGIVMEGVYTEAGWTVVDGFTPAATITWNEVV